MTPDNASTAVASHGNINSRGCKRRGRMGWVWLAVGALVVLFLISRAAPLSWYLFTALPFFMGMLGHYQAREQTCVFYAAFDQRDTDAGTDAGTERITDAAERSRIRTIARGIWVRSLVGTAVLTGVALAIGALVPRA